MHRRLYIGFLLGACVLLARSSDSKDKVETFARQEFAFVSEGEIEIRDSFGELRVEGWDRPDVHIVVKKATQKEYAAGDTAKALEHLARIVVTAERIGDRILVTTAFPGRNLFTRPLKGKSNVDLDYKIKVPRRSRLIIKHDIGEVRVRDIVGNMNVTARIGEITLGLPDEERYVVDARARIGDVDSHWDEAQRQHLVGARMFSAAPPPAHRIFVRLGIGQINVRPVRPRSEHPDGESTPRTEVFTATR